MALIASLAVGANGATTLRGSSRGISTPADRNRFLALHRSAGAIITGKESAAVEDYAKTRVPIFIFTRSPERLVFQHPTMQQIVVDRDLLEISRRIDQRISGDIVIEAGPRLLLAMAEVGAVDVLHLSITPIEGDGNFIETSMLLSNFEIESEEHQDGTQLLQGRYNGNAANR
jgi:riboflavin biosynthesis pyrimidine reductase